VRTCGELDLEDNFASYGTRPLTVPVGVYRIERLRIRVDYRIRDHALADQDHHQPLTLSVGPACLAGEYLAFQKPFTGTCYQGMLDLFTTGTPALYRERRSRSGRLCDLTPVG
jgi:hypothetical protein